MVSWCALAVLGNVCNIRILCFWIKRHFSFSLSNGCSSTECWKHIWISLQSRGLYAGFFLSWERKDRKSQNKGSQKHPHDYFIIAKVKEYECWICWETWAATCHCFAVMFTWFPKSTIQYFPWLTWLLGFEHKLHASEFLCYTWKSTLPANYT